MANKLPFLPPRYAGNDPYKKAVSEYLAKLHQNMDFHLGEMGRRMETLENQLKNKEE